MQRRYVQNPAIANSMNPNTPGGLAMLDGTVVREALMLSPTLTTSAITLVTLIAIPTLPLLKAV